MNADRVNRWLTLGANIGVLIGLIILALEIQQANRIAITSTELTVREAWGSVNETIYTNPQTSALLAKARFADAEFSDAEREMLVAFTARMMNIWEGIEEAYDNEMISTSRREITATSSATGDHERSRLPSKALAVRLR